MCCLGATVVLVKPTLPERDVLYQVEDSDVSFVLTEKESAEKIMNIHRKCQFKTSNGKMAASSKRHELKTPQNHIMLHIYTSGTTGLPKAVEISMYAFITSVELSRSVEFFKDSDVVLGWNPVTHTCGVIIPMIAFLSGAMVVPSPAGLSPKEFVDIVRKHKVTSLCAFPTGFRKLVFQLGEGLVPSLKRIIMSGTCSTGDLYHRILQVFQLKSLRNGYGFTEAFGFICIPAPNTIGYRSVGHPVPMVEYKIIDTASGRHLGPCEVGEITFRAPQHMTGYHKRPDATAEVLNEQRWLRSGDAGYYDCSGQLYIVERLKEMIKCLDQQVAPAEIEALLTEHPLVLEAAVVGIDNPEFGEAPTAFVVMEPSARGLVTEEELVRLVSDQTAFHKNLHGGVIFVDNIPKTDTGKYLRRELRRRHLDHLKNTLYEP
ncbi:hypothetical protein MTO96_002419 [Rhipicephalus appendiculatus]